MYNKLLLSKHIMRSTLRKGGMQEQPPCVARKAAMAQWMELVLRMQTDCK